MPRLNVPSMGEGRKVMRTPVRSSGLCARAVLQKTAASSAIHRETARHGRPGIGGKITSNIVSPIDVRENVVAPFAVREECFIDPFAADLIVKSSEAEHVILRSLGRVIA